MTDISNLLSQADIDELIQIQDFLGSKKSATRSMITEIRSAILDSGRLRLDEWRGLRNGLRELEELIPVIDMIIKLKDQVAHEKKNAD